MRRLASHTRWSDLELVFGKSYSALSEIFWETVKNFVQKMEGLLEFRPELMISRASYYAQAIYDKGSLLHNIVGFIDCTKIQISRHGGHGSNQRASYSGHKRFHAIKGFTV